LWRPSPLVKRRILLASLGLFAALLATGLLLQLGAIPSPAAPSSGFSHSEECHVANNSAESCANASASTCLVGNGSRIVVAGCGGVPTTSYCLNIGGSNYCIPTPDLNPADWVNWIWCSISSLVSNAIVAAVNNLGQAVQNQINSIWNAINNFTANFQSLVWNAIVGFFTFLLATINSGLQAFVNSIYQPVSNGINTFFADLTALVVAAMGALTNVFAWAGPLAPVVAMATFLGILGVVLWVSVQLVRLGLSIFKTTFNLL
jgi:hypothetical protein